MTLEPLESADLLIHEETIASGLQTFKEVGFALADIRDRRLYRAQYGTFEDYCQTRWSLSARHTNRIIEAAEVTREMGPNGPAITNEAQARAIKPVIRDHGPEVAAEILTDAAEDGKLTARAIDEAIQRHPATRPEPVEVLTSEEWEARQCYGTTDELAQRRRTDAEREALRAKSKADAIRQRNLDVNVAFSTIDEISRHPHILAEVQDNWQELAQHWPADRLHDLADALHQIADQWRVTA